MTNTINDKALLDIVNDDIREKADPEDAAWLRSPDMIPEWRAALVGIKLGLDSQLAMLRTQKRQLAVDYHPNVTDEQRAQQLAEIEARRSAIVRVKNGAEKRIVEANMLEATIGYADA